MSAPPKELPDFTALGTRIYLHRPPPATKPSSAATDPEPLLIIVCSWMGASPRHIAKYTAQHQTRFPHAQILLIQTSLGDLLFRTPAQHRARVEPAAAVVRAFESARTQQSNAHGRGRIVLHLFSNGGGFFACQLAAALAVKKGTVGLHLDALILDSCPGRGGHARTAKAIAVSLPRTLSFPLRLLAKGLIHVFLVLMWVSRVLFGARDIVGGVRRELNVVGGAFGAGVPRLYLYSKGDEMVGWKDVEEHAAEARVAVGAQVKEVVFEKSPHCGHIFENAKTYWDAVFEVICRSFDRSP